MQPQMHLCVYTFYFHFETAVQDNASHVETETFGYLFIKFFKIHTCVHYFELVASNTLKNLHCYAGITFPEIVMKMVAKSLHSALMVPSHMYMLLLHVYT